METNHAGKQSNAIHQFKNEHTKWTSGDVNSNARLWHDTTVRGECSVCFSSYRTLDWKGQGGDGSSLCTQKTESRIGDLIEDHGDFFLLYY